MPSLELVPCASCEHHTGADFTQDGAVHFCTAYPDGIPDDILDWKEPHLLPREGQKGDAAYRLRGGA